jgi:TolB protein
VRRTWPPVAVAALLATLVAVPSAEATFPGRNGRIVYESRSLMEPELEGGSRLVYDLEAAAPRGPKRFTLRSCTTLDGVPQDEACETTYSDPAYSPRGDRIVVDAGVQLAVMASDGSDFRLLPRQTADDDEPAWSPDGKRIVFTGNLGPGVPPDLFVLDVAAGTSLRLTNTGGRAAAWSRRDRIAFVTRYSHPSGKPERGVIASIRPNGGGQRRLTKRGGLAPNWSPHGTKIAFVRKGRLWVMRADGSRAHRIGREPISADDVVWSPNGKLFAVHSFESGFVVMRTDGTHERQIESGGSGSDYAFDNYSPDWQPLR